MPQDLIGCRKRRKLKALIPRVVVFVNGPPSAERRVDFAVFFIISWSYGRKIWKLRNSYGCSYFLWICFIYGTNVSVSWSSRCFLIYQQTSANQNTVHLKSGFIWKFSREWLFWTWYASGGSLRKKPQSPTVTKNEKHRIAVQGIFVGIVIKAGDASVKVTDLLFAFAFCKKQTRKTGVLRLVWLFAVC